MSGRPPTAIVVVAALALLTTTDACAEGNVQVSVPPPFDHWCVRPLCLEDGALPPPITPPPLLLEDTSGGYAESRLRAAIANQIDGWVKEHASEWNTKPIRDLARTAIAALSDDRTKLAAAQGLAASLVRVSLVLQLESALEAGADCHAAARRDAMYEGLAVARSLGAMSFPESEKTVLAACKTTFETTARAVDGWVLRVLDPDNELAAVAGKARKLGTLVQRAIEACASLPSTDPAAQTATLQALDRAKVRGAIGAHLDVVRAAKKDKDVLGSSADGPASPCVASIGALAKFDATPFASQLGRSLAGVDLRAFLAEIDAPALACTSASCVQLKELLELAVDGLQEQALRAMIASLRERLGFTVDDGSVFAGALRALDAAVVSSKAGAATIDPAAFVRALGEQYGLDDEGNVSALGPLKPVPLVFEANGGVPRLASNDVRFVGDLVIGWKTAALGVIAAGALSYYDFSTGTGATDTTRARGALEAWWITGDIRSPVRFEARVSGGVDYYDSTYVPSGPASTSGFFHDEDSLLGRGSLLLGVRLSPSPTVLLGVLLGGGLQYESYGYVAADPRDPNVLADTTSMTGRGNGRLLFRWALWPQIVAVRTRAEGSWFRLTRDVFTVSQVARPPSATNTTTEVAVIEVQMRAFLDLDVAKILGLVPTAWAGFDFVKMSDAGGEVETTVPSFGLGIVRPTF